MSAQDGGPAFPSQELNHDGSPYYLNQGMTLRAYFAAHVRAPDDMTVDFAAALNRRPQPSRAEFGDGVTGLYDYWTACHQWWAEAEAVYSVMRADALIAELAKVKP